MIRKTVVLSFSMILILSLAVTAGAETRLQGRGGNQVTTNSAAPFAFTGQVASVNMAPGQGYSFKLLTGGKEITVLMAPCQLLASQGFQIKAGAQLTVKALASFLADTYVATEIRDDASGTVITLPFQMGPGFGRGGGRGMRGGRGMGAGCIWMGAGAANLDPSALTVMEGTVQNVDMAFGRGLPNFTLSTAGGNVTVVASPFRALRDANFTISAGDRLLVRGFTCLQYGNAFAAVEIQNVTTGAVVRLR